MEKRALIAVVISLVILVVYQEVILKQLYGPPPLQQDATPVPAPEAAPAPVEPPPPPIDTAVEPSAPLPAVGGRDLTIETDLYRAVVTTAGARLKSFQLKRYRTSVAPDSPLLEMVTGGGQYPLGLQLRGGKEVLSDSGVMYRSDREQMLLREGVGTLRMTAEVGETTITKSFTFRNDSYLVGLEVTVEGGAAFSEIGVGWEKGIDVRAQHSGEQLYERVSLLQGKKLLHEEFANLADGKVLEKSIQWAGFDGRYFLAALAPSDEETSRVWLKQRDRSVETVVLVPRSDGRLSATVDVYVGPKDVDGLESAGHSLSRSVDLGYFELIALPLVHALKLSNRVTGNYGLDIILLTVVIKVLFIPLTQKSFKSMKAMQKLQPQMAKLRERFKDSPEQMNKEIMELYRRHKVNPLGGCLPMVLQIPVFVGLYNALSQAVELRHAPFFLWITDLSAPDRLGALPIPFVLPPGIPVLTLLMGVSMFVQQWMTPTAGDPAQQRVMMLMPIMFTFMFVSFPAGLTLYWLVNNVLTIGQQYVINRPER